jgi:hypothetical protein
MNKKLQSLLERFYPLLLAIAVAIVNWIFVRNYPLPDFAKDLFNATLSLASITVGFLTAAISILSAMDQKFIVQQLKQANIYRKLINYFIDAINWSFIVMVLDIFGLTISFNTDEPWKQLFFVFWTFSVSIALTSTYRIVTVFAKLLKFS